MNRTFKLYLIILGVVIVLLSILELNKTEVLDWRKTYDLNSKHPFGLFIFNQEIEHLLSDDVEITTLTPYQYFEENQDTLRRNYFFVRDEITTAGINKMLSKISKGDNAFVFNTYHSYLQDTLGYSLDYSRYEEGNFLHLLNAKFDKDSIYIKKLAGNMAIGTIDTLSTRILGYSLNQNDKPIANFIEIRHGRGKIYIHTEPLVITNFHMLRDNDYAYVEDIFSYLPKKPTIWFTKSDEVVSSSPLRFILTQPGLRYAWYLFLVGMLLFVFFTAKRRQRVIPVIEPLKNSSAEFVQTIGNLYLQEGNTKDMAAKKATYFLNNVRSDLMIDTQKLDEVFAQRLQLKTGAKKETIQKAIRLLEKALHAQAPVQEAELIELNKLLDEIWHK